MKCHSKLTHPPEVDPLATVEGSLEAAVARTQQSDSPPRLSQAIRYAVFPGGARVRPRLCVSVAHACGGLGPPATAAAAAIELLHCASLVHDDLPCFDNAPLRRGKASVHRKFGEPLAVLVGDALIVLAYETMTLGAAHQPALLAPILMALYRAAGAPRGLVAGQAWESEPSPMLESYHQSKTGALFVAATESGAMAAGADPAPWRMLGERLGLAYQTADDLRDELLSTQELGKPNKQDQTQNRPNAVRELGLEAASQRLRGLLNEAAESIPNCPGADQLRALVLEQGDRLSPKALSQSAA